MGTNDVKTLAAMLLATAVLGGCAEATTGTCGAGDAVTVNGSDYCVYKESVVIVGGFDCPASMPYRVDFEHATVCGNHSFDGVDVPEDICARVFVPCTEPEPDAGMVCDEGFGDCNGMSADGCERSLNSLTDCGECGVACSWPNASSSCDGGQCALLACNAGFADCDADPNNGCESALNTLTNCGVCGAVCSGDNVSCETGTCSAPLPAAADCSGGSTFGSAVECQAASLSCFALANGEACGLCLGTIDCGLDGCTAYSPLPSLDATCVSALGVWEGVCGGIRYRSYGYGYSAETTYWDVATGQWLASVSHSDYNAYCDGASFSMVMGDAAVVVGCAVQTDASTNLCPQ